VAKISFYTPDGELTFRLHRERTLHIGREPGNEVVLRDAKVSRRHAEIVFERGFFVLHDLDSSNGSFVNGHRIRVAPLTDGAELRLGNSYGRYVEEFAAPAGGPGPYDTSEAPAMADAMTARQGDNPPQHSVTTIEPRTPSGDPDPDPEGEKREPLRYSIESSAPGKRIARVAFEDEQIVWHRPESSTRRAAAAALLAVAASGLVVATLLAGDSRGIPALLSIALTVLFARVVVALVPRHHLSLLAGPGKRVWLTILELSSPLAPSASYRVEQSDGVPLALIRRDAMSLVAPVRWNVTEQRGGGSGVAVEEPLWKALLRKLLGNFFGLLATSFRLFADGASVAVIRWSRARSVVEVAAGPHLPFARRTLLALAAVVDTRR
jgi:hypothetical protein